MPAKIMALWMVDVESPTADEAMLLVTPAGVIVARMHIHMPCLIVADVVVDVNLSGPFMMMIPVLAPATMPFPPIEAAMLPVAIVVQPRPHTVGLAVIHELDRRR